MVELLGRKEFDTKINYSRTVSILVDQSAYSDSRNDEINYEPIMLCLFFGSSALAVIIIMYFKC